MKMQPAPNTNFSTLRVKASRFKYAPNSVQGNIWLTDGGAWCVKRTHVVKPGVLKAVLEVKVSNVFSLDVAIETIVRNMAKKPQIAMHIEHDEILESTLLKKDKSRSDMRLIYMSAANGQRVTVDVDILKGLMQSLAPRALQFWQIDGEPTTPISINDGSTVIGLIMPVIDWSSNKAPAAHYKAMKTLSR